MNIDIIKLGARFWPKVRVGNHDECWPWLAAKTESGYGTLSFGRGTMLKAHRVAFYLHYGFWPEPVARHSCDNTPCCNPLHLVPGTMADNNLDCKARGRRPSGDAHWNSSLPQETWGLVIAESLLCRVTQRGLGIRYGVSHTQVNVHIKSARQQARQV